MTPRSPGSTRTDTRIPYTTGFRSLADIDAAVVHHENLGDQALAGILLLAQEAGEGVADHRVDHRLAAGVGLGAPVLVHVVDVGLAEAGVLGVLRRHRLDHRGVRGRLSTDERRVGEWCVRRCRARWSAE